MKISGPYKKQNKKIKSFLSFSFLLFLLILVLVPFSRFRFKNLLIPFNKIKKFVISILISSSVYVFVFDNSFTFQTSEGFPLKQVIFSPWIKLGLAFGFLIESLKTLPGLAIVVGERWHNGFFLEHWSFGTFQKFLYVLSLYIHFLLDFLSALFGHLSQRQNLLGGRIPLGRWSYLCICIGSLGTFVELKESFFLFFPVILEFDLNKFLSTQYVSFVMKLLTTLTRFWQSSLISES